LGQDGLSKRLILREFATRQGPEASRIESSVNS
jgi:hypothetical protein